MKTIEQLESKLQEAYDIIEFYADRNNWEKSQGNYRDIISIDDTDRKNLIYSGGKLARQFLIENKILKDEN